MWTNELGALEECIRTADRLPKPTNDFRKDVLAEALVARRRSESVQRVQVLTAVFLAAAVLFTLPGYYYGLQNGTPRETMYPAYNVSDAMDAIPPYFSRTTLAAMAVAQPLKSTDDFEWGLIQAELTLRDHSARAFGTSL